ncbi:MAG: hypothetical protein IKT00_05730 [Prevotella sp.]|nr:hypothetical protein [Prevotella sp.]
MKRILSITLSLVGALLLTANLSSCGEQAQLDKAIAKYNAKMPQDAGGGMTIQQLTLSDTQMVYECVQSEEQDSIAYMREHQDDLKNGVVQNLVRNVNNEGFREIIQTLVNTDRSLAYSIKGAKTGETLNILVSKDELNDILAGRITATPAATETSNDSTAVTPAKE